MASNSHVNSPTCPKIELVQDFMAVLITCKSDEDLIKTNTTIVWTTFALVHEALKDGLLSCQ